jgi:hypothetical protein
MGFFILADVTNCYRWLIYGNSILWILLAVFWLILKMGQNINLTQLFCEKAQSTSASIEVEIYEQYVAVYTICAAHLDCKFPDLGYNG